MAISDRTSITMAAADRAVALRILGAVAAVLALASCAVASPARTTPMPANVNNGIHFAELAPDHPRGLNPAGWGELAGVSLQQSVAVLVWLRASVSLQDAAGVDFAGYSATLECSLGSKPGFIASAPMFDYRSPNWLFFKAVGAEFVNFLLVPTADGIDVARLQAFSSVSVVPSWNVGDRYACAARVVRPDGTVSGPSAPPLFLRVTQSYADIFGNPNCKFGRPDFYAPECIAARRPSWKSARTRTPLER
eukprot:tig00021036_g17284.t1